LCRAFRDCGFLNCGRREPPRYLISYHSVGKLHRAASAGAVALVEHFPTSSEYHVDLTDKKDRTALHYASTHNHPGVVCLLVVKKHCKINAWDDELSTPLIKAVQRENEGCVSILLKNGADPHAVAIYGNNALHYAVVSGNISIAEQLLNFSADIEGRTKHGFTPFMLSLRQKQEKMAEFLKLKGADVHVVVQCRREATGSIPIHNSVKIGTVDDSPSANVSPREMKPEKQ
ncbi:putative ankyrin repeat domain-containing protein 19, partial [Nannospalax galili]|uniref:putative ankyrin repeat domain-containing protein 19 n=1 Tax=Nannospalax galili TaxID=1026970 RepID=UPI000819FF31